MSLKNIDLHSHALLKIRERGLNVNDIIETVSNPDGVVSAEYNRKKAQKLVGKYWVTVIYEEDAKRILIITAYLTRKRRI